MLKLAIVQGNKNLNINIVNENIVMNSYILRIKQPHH